VSDARARGRKEVVMEVGDGVSRGRGAMAMGDGRWAMGGLCRENALGARLRERESARMRDE
jgi:hypothetical protein